MREDKNLNKSSEAILWPNVSTEMDHSEITVAYLKLSHPSAVMFIYALCSDILASVHGFPFTLPKHHPKDSLIRSPEYKSDLFYFPSSTSK